MDQNSMSGGQSGGGMPHQSSGGGGLNPSERSTGGPGSHGGKVIGYTRTGKPVYQNAQGQQPQQQQLSTGQQHAGGEHADYSSEDHNDARSLHFAAMQDELAAGDFITARQHLESYQMHEQMANDQNRRTSGPGDQDRQDNDRNNGDQREERQGGSEDRDQSSQGGSDSPFGHRPSGYKSLTAQATDILKSHPIGSGGGGGLGGNSGYAAGAAVGAGLAHPGGSAAPTIGAARQVGTAATRAVTGPKTSPTTSTPTATKGGAMCKACDEGKCSDHPEVSKAMTSRSLAVPAHMRGPAAYDPNATFRSATTQTSRMYTALAPAVAETLEGLSVDPRIRGAEADLRRSQEIQKVRDELQGRAGKPRGDIKFGG